MSERMVEILRPKMPADDLPAFEIRLDNRVIKIFANGYTEGLQGLDGSKRISIINRIPSLLAQAVK